MRALAACLVTGGALAAAPASAHSARDLAPDTPLHWTWAPATLIPLAVALALFAVGWWRLWSRTTRARPVLRVRALWFGLGWAVLAGALVSPLHDGGERSFALHMTEHELIMLVAAPALVLAHPLAIMLWAWPASLRRAFGRIAAAPAAQGPWRGLTAPVAATLLQAAALWLWHAPSLFDLALANDGWHAAQHISFLVTALLFWTAVLPRRAACHAPARALAGLCLFATSLVSGALGALMAFSTSPWYTGYARLGLAPFGLSPAQDQQIAGLIMWVPGGLVHALAALIVLRGLLMPPRPRRIAHAF